MGAGLSDLDGVSIRAGTAADRDWLVAIDSYAAEHPSRIAEIEEWLAAETLVAERAGQVLGYAAISRAFLGQPYVALLMVAGAQRRRGIGRRLLAAACDRYPRLWTSTNESNRPMQALLGRAGFRLAGRIEGLDVGDPELFYLRVHTT
jgi:GNAT superfamily N-acetyltransferase